MNSGEVARASGCRACARGGDDHARTRRAPRGDDRRRYHAATISCAASLEVIRAAKARKLPVTCGVSINHLTLNENDIGSYRTFLKVRPPLRREEDRVAMVAASQRATSMSSCRATIRRTPT